MADQIGAITFDLTSGEEPMLVAAHEDLTRRGIGGHGNIAVGTRAVRLRDGRVQSDEGNASPLPASEIEW